MFAVTTWPPVPSNSWRVDVGELLADDQESDMTPTTLPWASTTGAALTRRSSSRRATALSLASSPRILVLT
jgi:hypothetical protein